MVNFVGSSEEVMDEAEESPVLTLALVSAGDGAEGISTPAGRLSQVFAIENESSKMLALLKINGRTVLFST